MLTTGQRNARAALDAARASFDALDSTLSPDEGSSRLVAAWMGAEDSLRALAGSAALAGIALVRELRQRNLLTLDDAHTLVDFHAAAERAATPGYSPTAADIAVARASYDTLAGAVSREPGREGYDAAQRGGGAPPAANPASPDRADEVTDASTVGAQAPHRNLLGALLLGVALLAVLGAGAFYFFSQRSSEPSELATGRRAYAAGDRVTARNAFSLAASEEPTLAEPHIYLGRMAREEGNFPEASSHLRRAVELEPGSALAMRELAGYLLATGQLELARSFYERAIRLDPEDRTALGFMGCTLFRLGRPDLAQRFTSRAGPGSWQQCVQPPPMPMPGAPGQAPPPR